MSPILLDRLNVFGSIGSGHGVAQFAERLMTPTVKDRGGSSLCKPAGRWVFSCLLGSGSLAEEAFISTLPSMISPVPARSLIEAGERNFPPRSHLVV
jgi:hypothetical protein